MAAAAAAAARQDQPTSLDELRGLVRTASLTTVVERKNLERIKESIQIALESAADRALLPTFPIEFSPTLLRVLLPTIPFESCPPLSSEDKKAAEDLRERASRSIASTPEAAEEARKMVAEAAKKAAGAIEDSAQHTVLVALEVIDALRRNQHCQTQDGALETGLEKMQAFSRASASLAANEVRRDYDTFISSARKDGLKTGFSLDMIEKIALQNINEAIAALINAETAFDEIEKQLMRDSSSLPESLTLAETLRKVQPYLKPAYAAEAVSKATLAATRAIAALKAVDEKFTADDKSKGSDLKEKVEKARQATDSAIANMDKHIDSLWQILTEARKDSIYPSLPPFLDQTAEYNSKFLSTPFCLGKTLTPPTPEAVNKVRLNLASCISQTQEILDNMVSVAEAISAAAEATAEKTSKELTSQSLEGSLLKEVEKLKSFLTALNVLSSAETRREIETLKSLPRTGCEPTDKLEVEELLDVLDKIVRAKLNEARVCLQNIVFNPLRQIDGRVIWPTLALLDEHVVREPIDIKKLDLDELRPIAQEMMVYQKPIEAAQYTTKAVIATKEAIAALRALSPL